MSLTEQIAEFLSKRINRDFREELETDREIKSYLKDAIDGEEVGEILLKYAKAHVDKERYLRLVDFDGMYAVNREVVKLYNQAERSGAHVPEWRLDDIYENYLSKKREVEGGADSPLDRQLAALVFRKYIRPEPRIIQEFDTKAELRSWLTKRIDDPESAMRLQRWARRRVSMDGLLAQVKRRLR